jgi:hypothetical protein
MKTRLGAIQDAMAPWLTLDQSPRDLPQAFAAGIEAGLAWRGDEAVRHGWVPLPTEEMVITGDHRSPREKELEDQMDTVLRYLDMSRGWIPANDTEGHVEFRNLGDEVSALLEAWKQKERR